MGLRLEEMEMSEMLDIVHFFLEEDLRYSSGEEYEATNSVRTYIYESLYSTPYKYKGGSIRDKSKGGRQYIDKNATWDDLPSEFSPDKEVKPYIPPTEVNPESTLPFGSVLDSPIN